jgi:hypothetical protein
MKLRLSADERQSLIGPLVIGILVGGVAALASVAFDLEYADGARAVVAGSTLHVGLDAGLAFFGVIAAIVVGFGVLPIVLRRLAARQDLSSDE